jgi:hypothetical protein
MRNKDASPSCSQRSSDDSRTRCFRSPPRSSGQFEDYTGIALWLSCGFSTLHGGSATSANAGLVAVARTSSRAQSRRAPQSQGLVGPGKSWTTIPALNCGSASFSQLRRRTEGRFTSFCRPILSIFLKSTCVTTVTILSRATKRVLMTLPAGMLLQQLYNDGPHRPALEAVVGEPESRQEAWLRVRARRLAGTKFRGFAEVHPKLFPKCHRYSKNPQYRRLKILQVEPSGGILTRGGSGCCDWRISWRYRSCITTG